jgi:proteasome accessory factor B
MNIFLAMRLMQNYSGWYDPNIASTFMKLNFVVPPKLRTQIENMIAWTEKQPKNEKLIHIFEVLIQAWVSQHRVKVLYQDLTDPEPQEYIIEPYFIEPTTQSRAIYIIANCVNKKSLGSFKMSRIENIQLLPEAYVIPPDFNAIEYLSSAWVLFLEEPVEKVRLRFKPQLRRPIQEARWHSSQVMKPQEDDSLIMELSVNNTRDFRSWILGWGDEVEVLEPAKLRNQIIQINESVRRMYASGSGAYRRGTPED